MKTVGLLFFWSITWLFAGVPDRSLSSKSTSAPSGPAAALTMIDRPVSGSPVGCPGGDDLGAFLWDGEDSSDGDPGDLLDTGLGFVSPLLAEQAALAWFAQGRGGADWTSCQRLPLRC